MPEEHFQAGTVVMAPGLTEIVPPAAHEFGGKPVSKTIFPDGIKTSGQHPPLYDELRSFEDFPKEIVGPTIWNAEDYVNGPERWVHRFTEEEITEMSIAANSFLALGTPLTGISKVGFSHKYH